MESHPDLVWLLSLHTCYFAISSLLTVDEALRHVPPVPLVWIMVYLPV